MSSVPERSAVPVEYRWDLSSIFADDDVWEASVESVQPEIEAMETYEGRVVADASTLREVLERRESIMREVHRIASYAYMKRDEDARRDRYQSMATRAQSIATAASRATSYIDPELQSVSRETLAAYIDAEPALEVYNHYFDEILRVKQHTRSSEVEAVMANLGEVIGGPADIYNMLTTADIEFPTVTDPAGDPVEITQANFAKLQKHADRDFRRLVYDAFFDEWETIRHTVATSYSTSVRTDAKLAEERNYDSALEAALFGSNIPIAVYETLVQVVRDNLDLLHRHTALKQQALGVDEVAMWDLYMPIAEPPTPEIEYEDAVEYVIDSLEPLGPDYVSRVRAGIDGRWVDVYENEGKQSGAYSGGTYDTQPFILMNYQDDIVSMFTLAHELGHSLHSEYTREAQPWVYGGYEIFVAEVASTVNETLLTHHLLDCDADPHLKRHVLNEYLERFRSTLFRQVLFAEFEQQTHDIVESDGALTADGLDEMYRDLKETYYATAAIDDRIAREWMRIPHFYRAFYVYQYATGLSAAAAIADRILEEGEPAADRYLTFLSSGSSDYPLELLDIAGVDMRSADPIEEALAVYDRFVDQMADLIETDR